MRYAPLQSHLSDVGASAVTLTYDEIEQLLGRKLPPTAYGASWRQWWANTESHSQALAWLRAGWRVVRPDLSSQTVEFRRVPKDGDGHVGRRASEAPATTLGKATDDVLISGNQLTASAIRMIDDAAEERDIDRGHAIAEILNQAAMARRRDILDWFSERVPQAGSGSVGLIRQDRDAR